MKKKALILIISLIALLVLFFPIPSGALKDGGTREYTALTYKLVKWNRITSDGEIYKAWRIYTFPLNTKSVDALWKEESVKLTEENKEERTDVNAGDITAEKVSPVTTDRKESADETGFSVSVKEISLEGTFPYIKIEITNHSSTEFCFGETFDIFYRKSKSDIRESCFTEEPAFNAILYTVLPGGSADQTYLLDLADISKNGYYSLEARGCFESDSSPAAAEWFTFGTEFSVNGGKPENIKTFSARCMVDPVPHYHYPADEPQTVEDPISGYCGNIVTTIYINGKTYSLMYDKSVYITDILINLAYDIDKICLCSDEFTVDTELIKGCGINLTQGFARCEKGQAELTKEQIYGIKSIIDSLG